LSKAASTTGHYYIDIARKKGDEGEGAHSGDISNLGLKVSLVGGCQGVGSNDRKSCMCIPIITTKVTLLFIVKTALDKDGFFDTMLNERANTEE
jgi:hypothetical protein